MTTPAAEALYLAQHRLQWEGQPCVVFNPFNLPVEELPVIFGFNNGGSPGLLSAVAIAEDGNVLGGHCYSSEGYMPHDLGVIEGSRADRHTKSYQVHYPNGYRMEFVPFHKVDSDERLKLAFKRNDELKADSVGRASTQGAAPLTKDSVPAPLAVGPVAEEEKGLGLKEATETQVSNQ